MTSKSRKSNLDGFNTSRSSGTIPAIQQELKLCKKGRLKFDSIGMLAAHVSARISVHRTTLLRNSEYWKLLQNYQHGQFVKLVDVPDSVDEPEVLKAKLLSAQLEASNLRAELGKVKALLRRLDKGEDCRSAEDDFSASFSNLAMVLVCLLNRFPEFMQLDRERREIVDLSSKPSERVIVGKERLSQFVRWAEQNHPLPLVQAILLGDQR